jgi:hypothetical protein
MQYDYNRSFFSPELGTHLRVRYNTESYGQNEGNFNIGTMKLFDLGDAASFIDGQITMNDVDHVGYNVGIGYRWLDETPRPWMAEPARIMGVSLWSDGSSTKNEEFFSQIGLSLESLGDLWDFRANAYIPVGSDARVVGSEMTGEVIFLGSSLVQEAVLTIDTGLTVGELEAARRVANRDAWAFASVYGLTGGEFDSTGVKAGMRGYAFPDLMVQMAVTHDEIFDTNAVFSVAWFIGRTRANYIPTGTLADRLREPVLRNDYVAVAQSTEIGGSALTNASNEAIRIIHVNDGPGTGGSGTIDDPYRSLAAAQNGSQAGDIIFVHGGSQFINDSIVLKNNQRLLGEGDNINHTVVTSKLGSVLLPESSDGARSLAAPLITQTGANTSISLRRANEVNNFAIEGGTMGIDGTIQTSNPNLRNLSISDTTGDGISLQAFARNDSNDEDNDGNTTEIEFNVTIDDVVFDNVGGADIRVNADAGVDVTLPGTQFTEAISITDITSTNGSGNGIRLTNTHAGTGATRTATINRVTFDGNDTGIYIENARGIVNVNNTTIENTSGDAVVVINSGNVNLNSLNIENSGARGIFAMHDDDENFSLQWNVGEIDGTVGRGVDALAQGTGEFDLQIIGAEMSGIGSDGIFVEIGATARDADIQVSNSDIIVGDAIGFRLVGSQTTASSIDFLLSDNMFTSNSNSQFTIDIDANASALINATVEDNVILNNGTNGEFAMDTNNFNAGIKLRLMGNTANNGAGTFELTQGLGTFSLEDRNDTLNDLNNTGAVNNPGGGIINEPNPIPTPTF